MVQTDEGQSPEADRVLVTGATGFLAGHCISQLLEHGYPVRATMRSEAGSTRTAHLRAIAERTGGTLELVEADLSKDDGWATAVEGCAYVQHIASPFPARTPKRADDLVRPAVEGTRRVLRACAESESVRRVVLTSSIAAIWVGHPPNSTLNEDDWSVLEKCNAYQRSKTLAERAAWDYIAGLATERRLEMVVINPGMIFGPLLEPSTHTSMAVIARLLRRAHPGSPRLDCPVTDVRDLATAHQAAMEVPAAAGNRYICSGETMWMRDVSRVLATRYRGINTLQVPDTAVRLAGLVDPTARYASQYLGQFVTCSSEKAARELGWAPRRREQTILDAAESLIEHQVSSARSR